MAKTLLFSVTKKDCRWDYFRCPGHGGQKVNKTSSGVRCTHIASGAVGQACDERHQRQNKILAFQRMVAHPRFKVWHAGEVRRLTGQEEAIQRRVQQELRKVRVEGKDEAGRWVEIA